MVNQFLPEMMSLLTDGPSSSSTMATGVSGDDAAASQWPAGGSGDEATARCVACNSTERVSVHYNAMSCHGCKAFFRRTVFERRKYCCSAEGRCEITDENRNQCRACRFQKCVRGGMNPKHVREERAKRRLEDSEHEQFGDPPKIVLVEEHTITHRLMEIERSLDRGEMGERAELRRRIMEQYHVPDIDLTTNFNCERVMNDSDLTMSYYLAFMILSEWASEIPDFTSLSQQDQMLLFRQNFMIFGWMHFVYRGVCLKQERIGLTLGNGSYVPYREEDRALLDPKWQRTYGVIAKKLIDMVGIPMAEMDVDYEEYVLLKAMSLFQIDNQLSEEGQRAVGVHRDRLLNALIAHIERRFPLMTATQRSQRSVKLSLLFPSLMAIMDELVRHHGIDPLRLMEQLRRVPDPSVMPPVDAASTSSRALALLLAATTPGSWQSLQLPQPPRSASTASSTISSTDSQIGHLEATYVQQLATHIITTSSSSPSAAAPARTSPLTISLSDDVQSCFNNINVFCDTVPRSL